MTSSDLSTVFGAAGEAVSALRRFAEIFSEHSADCNSAGKDRTEPCDDGARVAVHWLCELSFLQQDIVPQRLSSMLEAILAADNAETRWLTRKAIESCGPAWGALVMTTTHLTARERSVVHLAICGMKNREIAAELHLSVKTIEFHLANVYGKLSIRSRQDLRRRLTESA